MAKHVTEYTLSEGTKAFIERMVSERLAEDLKDPEFRRLILGTVDKHYRRERKRLAPARRRARAKTR